MNYLNVKENHLFNIFSSDSGRKDLQTVMCVCVCSDLYTNKEREREGEEDGCKEKTILRNVLRY